MIICAAQQVAGKSFYRRMRSSASFRARLRKLRACQLFLVGVAFLFFDGRLRRFATAMLFRNATRHGANFFARLRRQCHGREDRAKQKCKRGAQGAKLGCEILLRRFHDFVTLTQAISFLHLEDWTRWKTLLKKNLMVAFEKSGEDERVYFCKRIPNRLIGMRRMKTDNVLVSA